MRQKKQTVGVGLLSVALFLFMVLAAREGMATYWGYQPDSEISQCLAAYTQTYSILVNVFPDRASAHAAAEQDCAQCGENSCGRGDDSCVCSGLGSPPVYCYAWGYYDCNPSAVCTTCGGLCGVPFCGYTTYGCRSGLANARRLGTAAYSSLFVYPMTGCPGYIAPIVLLDPLVVVEEKNLGGSGPGSTAGQDGTSCDDFVCNPVKVATGNKYEKVLDISISTPGVPFEFVRHYNSLVVTDGTLGYGWTHAFCANVQVVQTTPIIRVRIKDEDGRALYFSQLSYSNTGEIDFYGESGIKDRFKLITSTGQYVLQRKKGNLTYLFGSDGLLLQISDPNGNTLTYTYAGGLLTQVSNNFGNSLTFQYSGGRISSVIDPKGQSVSYAYTGSDLTGVSYPDGRSLSYAYSNHNLTDKYDSTGLLIGHWDYDAAGRVSNYYRYVDSDGVYREQAGFTYNLSSADQPVTVERSTGSATYKTAIKDGVRVITEIDNCATCGGITKLFAYDSYLNLISVTVVSEGQSYTTRWACDSPANSWTHVGEVIRMREAVGLPGERFTYYTYSHRPDDPFLLTQSTETKASVVNTSQNKVTTTTYNTQGSVSSKTETGYTYVGGTATPASRTTSYQYNSSGQLIQIDGPRTDVSDITTFAYYPNTSGQGNNRGRLMSVTNALGQATLFTEYDGNGNVGAITDPNGIVTRRTYDQRNRVLSVTNQTTNGVTQYGYDSHGNLSSVTYPEGNRIDFTYNLGDRIIEITDSLGNRIQYTYDDQGNRISEDILDPQGTLRKYVDYTYDAYNRLSTIVNPDATSTVYTYDGRGNVSTVRDPRNHATAFTYDALTRKSSMTQPFTSPISYGYDSHDNPVSVTDPNRNVTHYVFDDFGNKYQTVSPDTGTSSHTYDSDGNLTRTIDANGNTITYSYDALNRLILTHFPQDPAQDITNAYDSPLVSYGMGRLTGRVDPSGVYSFHYDSQGNMVGEEKTVNGVLYTTLYTYNKNNRLTSLTYPTGRTVTYTMDQSQRISQVDTTLSGTTKTLASSVAYLPFGGVTALLYGNNLSLTQAYDNQYRLSTLIAGSVLYRHYGYDGNGNITTIVDSVNPSGTTPIDPLTTYTYETGSNVLTRTDGPTSTVITSDPKGNTITENTRTYVYDTQDQLIEAWDNNTRIAQYTYNGAGQRIKKTTAAGTQIFHYDTKGRIIAETTGAGQMLAEYIYLKDRPLATIRPGEAVYYYHNDHLGTPQVLTDSTGNVAWKAAYTAFGKAVVSVATVENNFRFPGQYYDSETGLSYNYYRYYKAETGRYITSDPIGLEGGINPFVYVANSPLINADRTGLNPVAIGAGEAIYGCLMDPKCATAAVGAAFYAISSAGKSITKACEQTRSERVEFCDKRWEKEDTECGARPTQHQRGCRERAAQRRSLCLSGLPEPPRWGSGDEESSWNPLR